MTDLVSTLNGYVSVIVYHLISLIWLDRCNTLLLPVSGQLRRVIISNTQILTD